MKSSSVVPGLHRRPEQLLHLARHRKLHPGLLSRVEDEVDVLLHQRRGERRGEVVPQERLGLVSDERRAGGRVRHHVEEVVAGDAGGFPEHQGLRHQLGQPGDHEIDRELHDPSLLAVPDVLDGGANRPDDRLDSLECLQRAGNDDAQVPGRTTVGLPLTGARR